MDTNTIVTIVCSIYVDYLPNIYLVLLDILKYTKKQKEFIRAEEKSSHVK